MFFNNRKLEIKIDKKIKSILLKNEDNIPIFELCRIKFENDTESWIARPLNNI